MPSIRSGHIRPYSCSSAIFGLLLALVVIIFQLLPAMLVHATTYNSPIPLSGTLSPLVAHSRLSGSADPHQRISLSIGLRPRNQQGLTSSIQDILHPGSVSYHRFFSPMQYISLFSPDKASYLSLSNFLQASGFTITHRYNHRLLIDFSGTVEQVERTFHVAINTYIAPDKHLYYANNSEPLLPPALAREVLSFNGLSNAAHWRSPSLVMRPLNAAATPSAHTCPRVGRGAFTPDQVAAAYNLTGLYQQHLQGEGQTIALFELDTFQMSDLKAYAACFGHNHTAIQMISSSSPSSTGVGQIEVELDAEVTLSAAPQLGLLKIYEADNNITSYLAQWAQIIQDAPPVVSTSWGLCEQLIPPDLVQQENVFFQLAALQGESILVASGDSGSAGCALDSSNSSTGLSANDPSSQPFVTSVGGTSLSLNDSGYDKEAVWNNASNQQISSSGGASGGGISQFWTAPGWQNAPGVTNQFSSGLPCKAPSGSICRETPDVSLSADPYNGYPIYCTVTLSCNSLQPWTIAGGTSASTPMWAVLIALANEKSLKQGGLNLGFVSPLLYQIASSPTTYAACFHDITTGNNDYNGYNSGVYPATEGYDMATGLGSYNALPLVDKLVEVAQKWTGQRASPGSMTWYFAEGSVGGGFQQYLTLQNPSVAHDASVSISYLFPSHSPLAITHTVSKSSRTTVNVNTDLHIPVNSAQQQISVIINVAPGDPAIIAERPMYFNYKGIKSGTDIIGATSPASTYYFPVVDTRQDGRTYYSYITILNPSKTQEANITLTYFTGACGQDNQASCPTQKVTISPLHRGTTSPFALSLHQRMAVMITSDQPVVAERPMYFKDTIPSAGGITTGAASEVGARTPGNDWLFAEGYTGNNFQQYLVLANYKTSSATAKIMLIYSNGHSQAVNITIPPLSQQYFDVNQANSHPTGECDTSSCQVTPIAAAEIISDIPIVAERLMYFHFGSKAEAGATETLGEVGPAAHNTYAFAEGSTADMFQEYLALYNPTPKDESVAITLFADTYIIQQQVVIKAHSRQSVSINPLIVPIAQAYNNLGADSYAVSLVVQALGSDSRIIAERSLYFDLHGDQGGTDVIGYTG